MKRLLALCRKELLLLARDRHGLLVLFVMPTAFILVMSFALRGAFDAQQRPELRVHIDNQDGAPLSLQLVQGLRESSGLALSEAGNDAGDADRVARLTIQPGFSELLATRYDFAGDYRAGEAEPSLMTIEYSPTLPPQLRLAIQLAIRQIVVRVQSDYLLAEVLDRPAEEQANLRYLFDPGHLPIIESIEAGDGSATPNAVQQSVPAWLIFALFFTVIPLATTFVIEREQGSLLRLRVLNVGAPLLFASKLLPYYAVNLVQIALMLVVGVYLVPALGGDRLTLGHSALGLWLIGSATSLAAISLAMLVAVNVRSILQATAAGGALCLLMGALGGIMVPKMVMPAAMQTMALISPMSWALEGYWDILLRGGDWRSVLPECGVLVTFAALCLTAAALSQHFRHAR